MRRYDTGTREKRPCRSASMTAEEINQERSMSGWNPYAGEEEEMVLQMPRQEKEERRMVPRQEKEDGGMMPRQEEGAPAMMPYFMQPEYAQILEEQKQTERDLRMLQSMYPSAAKILLPYIEEECDKMEYEGSSMYAQYPDQTTVMNIQNRIYDQVKDQFQMAEPEAPDDMLSMQFHGSRRDPRGKNWLDDMIRILLLQEMHHRRCRHRGCRRTY